ncbi:cyclin-dependent kinase 2-interacting protein-like [Phymastichus coffea]|uniref:cyclin-dependent kinase 2-interacting protein-like n=1 Tax=Phymastichus coffea TaxID=108790 RepID=UPI00273C0809|nr:cyclin-dependent kinase 2-interacting protein-like [Phymastichus coffea]
MVHNQSKKSSGFPLPKIVSSPGSKITLGQNFTGLSRLVRDNVADVHANIQQWNTLYHHGVQILNKIILSKVDETYPNELVSLCEDLEKICDEMDTIVGNLRILADKMEKISQLPDTDQILFSTWHMKKFVSITNEIYNVHKKEATVKRIILENVAHEYTESLKVLHIAAWLYQPFIPDNINIDLETMLIETKLRQLQGKT